MGSRRLPGSVEVASVPARDQPQALRLSPPPTVGFLVQLIKGTSLASVVGFVELARAGQIASAATFQPLLVYSCVALLYFAACCP